MKKELLIAFSFFTLVSYGQLLPDNHQPKTKKLIWSEEFDQNGLPDETRWNFEVGKARANNEPQYLILNQALWVNFKAGEPGIDDSIFPQQFLVDYVRVYELN